MIAGMQILVLTDSIDEKLLKLEAKVNAIIKQRDKFKSALHHIAYGFMTTEEIQENDIGLSYTEQLEMAYENIQELAKSVYIGR